jgi:hypothetical protein
MGQTLDQRVSEIVAEGTVANVMAAASYSTQTLPELDLTETLRAVDVVAARVQAGDLGGLEAMLTAQVITLNTIFCDIARKASCMQVVDQIDRFTRLAFKAQGQCRATVETLAMIRNPPVFARQANIAHGPQQINNGTHQRPLVRAEIDNPCQNKLLEAHGERLDESSPSSAGSSDSPVATLAEVNRTANG